MVLWHEAHIGVDAKSGLVHTVGVTTGSVHDAKVMDHLIREDDRAVFGDRGYANDRKQRQAEAAGVLWAVKAKAKPGCPLSISQRRRNRRFGKIRAKVEHVFQVMKCQFGYRKVRYRGIAKNGAQKGLRAARARQPIPCPQDTRVRIEEHPGGESLSLREGRNYAGTSINNENPAPPSTHREKVTLLRGSLEGASGKYDIARWAPEADGWVRENGEPIKITPSYWNPIEGENYLAATPETVAAVKTGSTAVEPKRSTRARNRLAAFSIAASLVGAACTALYFRAEVTSFVAQHAVRQDLLRITTIGDQVVGQASRWLSRNFEREVSPAQMSQGQNTQQVDASARYIAPLRPQTEADSAGPRASKTLSAKTTTLLEPAAIDVDLGRALAAERDRGAALASELSMARRDFETKTALLSKAADEAAQFRRTAEATATELRQSLLQERDRAAALARELATARRDLETEVALSSKAGEEAEQLRQAAKAVTAGLEQERNRSAALARDLESAQRVISARSTTERPVGSQIDPKQVAERAAAEPSRPAAQGNPEVARLMGRASALLAQGNIGAARIVLERAAETGSAEASFALAETYDPLVLTRWGTYGTRGEATKARELYAKAQAGGIQEANDRINALRQ